jgi:hypothetical protein
MTTKKRKPLTAKQKVEATARRAANRQKKQTADYLRGKLNGAMTVNRLNTQLREVIANAASMDPEELAARKLVIDTCLRIMRHLVPTLRAVELSTGTEDNALTIKIVRAD